MAALKFFTLRGRALSVVADTLAPEDPENTDPETKGVHAGLTITPSVKGMTVLKAATLSPNPALIVLAPIEARIDDGQIKLGDDQVDVRLVAKCSALGIGSENLIYECKPHHVTYNGASQSMASFTITAPTIADDDVTVHVVDVATAAVF